MVSLAEPPKPDLLTEFAVAGERQRSSARAQNHIAAAHTFIFCFRDSSGW